MTFEWDGDKAAANLVKHGVSFEEASSVFEDRLLVDFYDPNHSEKEERYIIIGASVKGRLLIVSYSETPSAVRIISARELTRTEKRKYEER